MSELELLLLVRRARLEYEEMPGLALTIPQAARRTSQSPPRHTPSTSVPASRAAETSRAISRIQPCGHGCCSGDRILAIGARNP
jgi:hypothetical protein